MEPNGPERLQAACRIGRVMVVQLQIAGILPQAKETKAVIYSGADPCASLWKDRGGISSQGNAVVAECEGIEKIS
ncbi:MAG: hypothetical protein LAN71_07380 [Acidobacteriia bacterium]|nr:hypothetical protein [Terriglobia bacterium]